jgi:NodT family efflux transporter outer membrane factor (OMF) lipoprotein
MNLSRAPIPVLAVVLTLFLSSCTMLGPDFKRPETTAPASWSVEDSEYFATPSGPEGKWWSHFNDAVLNTLVERAYQQNLPLQQAGLRIFEARARLGLVRGERFPQTQEMTGDLFTTGIAAPAADRYFNSASIGFDTAWEIDFWGKFRRAIESADAELLAAVADYDDLQVSLTAEVASLYVNLRTLEKRIALAEKNAELQENTLMLIELQFEAGVVTELDILQARTLLATTRAAIPSFEASRVTVKNSLALLLALLPAEVDALLEGPAEIPEMAGAIAVSMPAELLRRRPDIRRAEMAAAAQSAEIGIALADLYPSFTLFGAIGWSTSDSGGGSLDGLFTSDNFTYNFGPAFRWNLFNYGRLKNQVRIEDARLQQLLAGY